MVAEIQLLVDGVEGMARKRSGSIGYPRQSNPHRESDHAMRHQPAVLNEDDLPFIKDFIAEAMTHLDTARPNSCDWSRTPAMPIRLTPLFRSFHTIKGVAGFLNLTQIGSLAHVAESLLDLARQGRLQIAAFGQASCSKLPIRCDRFWEFSMRRQEGHNRTIHDGVDDLIDRFGRSPKVADRKLPRRCRRRKRQ